MLYGNKVTAFSILTFLIEISRLLLHHHVQDFWYILLNAKNKCIIKATYGGNNCKMLSTLFGTPDWSC